MGTHDMLHDDRMLLEQWSKKGDGEAFATLVSRYGGMVYGACRRILGNPSDAEDIAQECFEALATAGTKPGSYVGAWLHRVATYHAISHIRGDLRRREREMLYSTARKTESTVEWTDIYAYVDEAIDELPEKLRRPLIAHYLEGQSKEAVGQALGLSRQLASYRIDRGLERVRAALQRKGVSVGALLLASLMGANAAEAASAVLVARLGRIVLAGPNISAPVAAAAAVRAASSLAVGASAVKVISGVAGIAAVVAVVLLFGWKEMMRPYPTQDITAASTFSVSASVPVEKRLAPALSEEGEGEGEVPVPSGAVQVLEPGTVVYGVVLDESGQPVSRATVTLDNQEVMEEQRFYSESTAAHEVNLRQTTNVQGEFAFERVPMQGGQNHVFVLAARSGERCAEKTIGTDGDSRQRFHELVLSPAGVVRGKVIDEKNAGVPRARVGVCHALMRGEMVPLTYITKADGTFESRPLPQGMYELYLSAAGFLEPQRLWVYADGTTNVIRLERKGPFGSISGWVVSAEDGRRMPGLGIKVTHMPEVTTGANGEFRIEGLAASLWAFGLSGRDESYALAEPRMINLSAGEHVTDIELKVTRALSVSGQVLAEDTRKPVAYAGLVFQRSKDGFGTQTTADENGRFTIAQLGPGDYVVRMGPSSNPWSKKTTPLSVHGDMENVELLMDPFRAARGTVVNGSGAPVAGASVLVVPNTNFVRLVGDTDAAGAYEIALAEKIESFYVQAYGDGGMSQLAGPLGIGDRPELRLEDTGAIEGAVVDSAGQPVARAIVAAIPEDDELITALNADGSEWDPDRGIFGIKARTSLTGAFQMAPVLPGRIRLEVYLPSSAKGYPVAETPVMVRAGETLKTTLVLDLAGYASIEGTVTSGGAPIPFVPVEAYSPSRDWMTSAETLTGENGHYTFVNIRAGKVRVSVYGEGHNSKNQVIQLAENETRTLDFNIEQHDGGIEGYFTINGKPGTGNLSTETAGEGQAASMNNASTDGQGYYRIANLAPGTYTVRLQNFHSRNEGKRIMPESTVEVSAGAFTRCDFALEAGGIEGVIQGLGPGEKAGVGLFPGIPDPGTVAAMAASGIEAMMTTYMETPSSGEFRFDDIPPGTYSLGVVALPTAREGTDPESMEPHVVSALAAGRYAIQSVEVVAGDPVKLDVSLPR